MPNHYNEIVVTDDVGTVKFAQLVLGPRLDPK